MTDDLKKKLAETEMKLAALEKEKREAIARRERIGNKFTIALLFGFSF